LFSLTLQVKVAEHALRAHDLPNTPALGAVIEIRGLARDAHAELRALIFELRPEAVREEGLVAALRKQAAALSGHRQIQIDVRGPSERLPLSDVAEEHAYRLAREALGNAVSHAAPRTVQLDVRLQGGDVVLIVHDDGCGFDPGAAYAGHLGLLTMRERAIEAGGILDIVSAPGEGTTVRATLPLSATGGRR
jgi:signal transduction histidine kinase